MKSIPKCLALTKLLLQQLQRLRRFLQPDFPVLIGQLRWNYLLHLEVSGSSSWYLQNLWLHVRKLFLCMNIWFTVTASCSTVWAAISKSILLQSHCMARDWWIWSQPITFNSSIECQIELQKVTTREWKLQKCSMFCRALRWQRKANILTFDIKISISCSWQLNSKRNLLG